jgi:hypothetical protein
MLQSSVARAASLRYDPSSGTAGPVPTLAPALREDLDTSIPIALSEFCANVCRLNC